MDCAHNERVESCLGCPVWAAIGYARAYMDNPLTVHWTFSQIVDRVLSFHKESEPSKNLTLTENRIAIEVNRTDGDDGRTSRTAIGEGAQLPDAG